MSDTNPNAKQYRKISPIEWAYIAATKHFPPFAIQLRIQAKTLPPLLELERALVIAADANSGARLTVANHWWLDNGIPPQVSVVPSTESFSLSHPYLHKPFSFDKTAPIEVLYWEGSGLIFRCSHALMDAGGLLFFAQETFRALRGESLLGTTSAISDYEYLAGLEHQNPRASLRADKNSPLGAPTQGKTGFVWEYRYIPGQVVSVSARLAAVLGRRMSDAHPDCITRVMLPVDLRQTNSTLRSTANLSNALFLELPLGAGWTAYYRDILEALGRHDERATSGLDVLLPWIPRYALQVLFRWLHERQVRNNQYLFSATLSTVGPVSLSAFSALGSIPSSVTLLPFDTPGSAVTLITIQHDNGLEISASCPAATNGEGRLGNLLDLICAELGQTQDKGSTFNLSQLSTGAVDESEVTDDDLSVYGLFAQQAKTHPQRVALSEGGKRLSYIELEHLAKACARRLQQKGVKPGDKVAILANRCMESVIALLGILHVGASFVPLDPDWPIERIRFVLADCLPGLLLTDKVHAVLTDFPNYLMLSAFMEALPGVDSSRVESSSKTPAYVLYTSGSTGKPKGVVVGQASFINYLLWAKDAYVPDTGPPLVFPFFTSLAFDLTLTSILLPIVSGGEIRIFPQGDPLRTIRAILSDTNISAIKLTPSHLRLFAQIGIGKSNIRRFIVGGEALSTKLAGEINLQAKGLAVIFNEYGPTEATIGCVMHRFEPESDVDAFVPIGIPIANTEIFLLDHNAVPVADGEAGEIFLAGACLAMGYLDRPTEDVRFVPHPFRVGKRAYRTGDRARRLQSGNLDFLGRSDDQVKVLGHRIELGEINLAIEASGLCRACAILPEEFANDVRIVAFVTWNPGACEADLRDALAKTLPAYMLPSRIIEIEEMPLNVNGKVDKSALPMDRAVSRADVQIVRDSIESALLGILMEITGNSIVPVSMDESLIDVGIDSMQMMMLLTLSAQKFLPEMAHDLLFLGLEEFIRKPTLQNLAKHLRKLVVDHEKRM